MRIRGVFVVVAAAALSASVMAPASAETHVFKDEHGDVKSGFDIHSVRVDNNGPRVTFTSKHKNLTKGPKAPGGSVTVSIDIAKNRKGPELMTAGPVGFDGDYHLTKVRNWKMYGKPVSCKGLRFNVNYKRNLVRFSVPRRCMDRAFDHDVRDIRVNVKASQLRRGPGKPKRDWMPKPRQLSKAVARN